MPAQNRVEISRFAHPDVLLARIARHIFEPVLREKIINEPRAIHAAICGIGRAIRITEILLCQSEAGVENLAHFRWVTVVTCNLVRRKSHVGRAFFFRSGTRRTRGAWGFSWTWDRAFFGRSCRRRRCFFALRFRFRRRSRGRSWRSLLPSRRSRRGGAGRRFLC